MKLVLIFFVAVTSAAVLPEEKPNTSSLSFGDTLDISVPFVGDLEGACLTQTGSNDTFEEIITTTFMVPLCFAINLEVDRLMADAQDLAEAPETKRVEFFNRYCPQVKTSLRCITQVTELVRKCVEPDRIPLYDTFVNTIPEAVDLICKNHGELIFVDGPNLKECSEKLSRSLDDCSNNLANISQSTDLSTYGEYQCTELGKIRQCYEKELADCRVPRMIELFDLFYRPLVTTSPCRDFIKLDVVDELKEVENNNI